MEYCDFCNKSEADIKRIKTIGNRIEEQICKKYNIDLIEKYDGMSKIINGKQIYTKYSFRCNRCGYEWKQAIRFDRNLSCPRCFPSEHGSSKGELELYNYFLTTGLKVEHNNREALNGKELDIYLPELNVGIEYDGAFWHNEEDDTNKDLLCEQKGIKLYRVSDEEWINDEEKILDFFEKELNVKFEEISEINTFTNKSQKVIDLSTLKVYNSAKEAAEDIGIKEYRNINNVCNGNLDKVDGRKFEYYDSNKKYSIVERKLGYHTKKVKCVETNEIFNTLTEAINKYGKSVWDCLNGRQKTAYKMHWGYLDENGNLEHIEYTEKKRNTKRIMCIENGKTYNSAKEAGVELGIKSYDAIYRVCTGKQKTSKGYTFKYVE